MKEGWEYKKLGEVCHTSSGGTPSRTKVENYEDGKIPWLRSGEVAQGLIYNSEMYITEIGLKNSSAKLFPIDTVVLAMYGATVGQVGLLKKEMSTNQAICGIYPNDKFIPMFLLYTLKAKKSSFIKEAVGGAQPNISQNLIKNTLIPVPPLSEQQHIVEELDLLSSIIEKKKAQQKELDNLAQSIFYEMFGDPITNEKGWEKNFLKELAKVTSSKRILQSEWQECGIPFYKVADIINMINGENITPSTFIQESTYKDLMENGLVPKASDILITSRGTLGLCYIVKENDSFYFQDGMITWLSNINKGLIIPTFLVALFTNNRFSYSLKHSANSSTVAYISIKQLSNIQIPLPPLPLQELFASKIQSIEHQKALIKQSITEVETLFNSRMDYYFN